MVQFTFFVTGAQLLRKPQTFHHDAASCSYMALLRLDLDFSYYRTLAPNKAQGKLFVFGGKLKLPFPRFLRLPLIQ